MSSVAYFALWLVAALVAVGFLSAFIAQQRTMRHARREQALRMMDALSRYSDWLGSQRHVQRFDGESAEAAAALDAACAIRIGWFPELAAEMAELLAMHNRLMLWLAAQDRLRERDPDAWLESDHDTRFMAMWRAQVVAMHVMRGRLGLLAHMDSGVLPAPSTYPSPGIG